MLPSPVRRAEDGFPPSTQPLELVSVIGALMMMAPWAAAAQQSQSSMEQSMEGKRCVILRGTSYLRRIESALGLLKSGTQDYSPQ